jgi:hypothetical protein
MPWALAVLAGTDMARNEAVIRAAIAHAAAGSVVFLYLGAERALEPAGVFRLAEAQLHDPHARAILGRTHYLAHAARTEARFVYRHTCLPCAFHDGHDAKIAEYKANQKQDNACCAEKPSPFNWPRARQARHRPGGACAADERGYAKR